MANIINLINICGIWSFLALFDINPIFEVAVDFRRYNSFNDTPTQFNITNVPKFDATKKHIVLCHGWVDHYGSDLYTNVTHEFRNNSNVVIIQAGYEEAMSCTMYLGSVFLLKRMGTEVGELILAMHKDGVPLENIEIIGHSLGAHVAGIAGHHVTELTNEKIGRIYGLDPAQPFILPGDHARALGKNDAKKVIVIHTSILGMQNSIGHVDFYPNGGLSQGSCGEKHISNHCAANYYLYCSINYNCEYKARRCNGWLQFVFGLCYPDKYDTLMGYNVDDNIEGDYYGRTSC